MNDETLRLVSRALIEAIGSALLMASATLAVILPERNTASGGENLIYPGAAYAVVFALFTNVLRSGIHPFLTPALTLSSILRGAIERNTGMILASAQIAGAFAGVIAAQAALNLDAVQSPLETQFSVAELLANTVGTFLFVLVMIWAEAKGACVRGAIGGCALFVIYLATSAHCLANPAATLARTLTSNALSFSPAQGFFLAAGEVLAAWLAIMVAERFTATGKTPIGP